jgi:hypothetical protein
MNTQGDKNRLQSNSDFTHFQTKGDIKIQTIFEKYKIETLEAVFNPPGPLELPHETQLNFEEADLLVEAILPDMI